MFSLLTSFSTPSALGRIFSLDSWLAHLKSWHHGDRRHKSNDAFHQDSRPSCAATFIPVSLSGPLTLDLPSPTVHLTFEPDLELFETDSETSSAASSRCSTPSLEEEPYLESALISSKIAQNKTTTTTPPPVAMRSVPPFSTESLLAQYSRQELVLLEFLTHSSNVDVRDIDEILCMYPPGFISACHCAKEDEDVELSKGLCKACQLADAYIEYSFQRCQGAAEVMV